MQSTCSQLEKSKWNCSLSFLKLILLGSCLFFSISHRASLRRSTRATLSPLPMPDEPEAAAPAGEAGLSKNEQKRRAKQEAQAKAKAEKAAAKAAADAAKPKPAAAAQEEEEEEQDPTKYFENRLTFVNGVKEKGANPYPHKFQTSMQLPDYVGTTPPPTRLARPSPRPPARRHTLDRRDLAPPLRLAAKYESIGSGEMSADGGVGCAAASSLSPLPAADRPRCCRSLLRPSPSSRLSPPASRLLAWPRFSFSLLLSSLSLTHSHSHSLSLSSRLHPTPPPAPPPLPHPRLPRARSAAASPAGSPPSARAVKAVHAPARPGHLLLAHQVTRRELSEPGLVFFDVVGDGAKVQVFASADKFRRRFKVSPPPPPFVWMHFARHLRDTSETLPRPPRHLRHTSDTPPTHLRDLRDTSETLPRHLRDTS